MKAQGESSRRRGGCSRGEVAYHLGELAEVESTRAVVVVAFHGRAHVFARSLHSQRLEGVAELFAIEGACAADEGERGVGSGGGGAEEGARGRGSKASGLPPRLVSNCSKT